MEIESREQMKVGYFVALLACLGTPGRLPQPSRRVVDVTHGLRTAVAVLRRHGRLLGSTKCARAPRRAASPKHRQQLARSRVPPCRPPARGGVDRAAGAGACAPRGDELIARSCDLAS
jgi:hypothetical protein